MAWLLCYHRPGAFAIPLPHAVKNVLQSQYKKRPVQAKPFVHNNIVVRPTTYG